MTERLTKWQGRDPDGTPRAALARREGSWPENYQAALRKLALYEDAEEDGRLRIVSASETQLESRFREMERVRQLEQLRQLDMAEIVRLRRLFELQQEPSVPAR